jgi:glutamate/tyrosine decarboxylase-like PLP-dependent enzyme
MKTSNKQDDPTRIDGKTQDPLSAWFLGPKAENSAVWKELINYVFDDYIHWRRNYFPKDPIIVDRIKRRNHEFWYDKLTGQIDTIIAELKAHYPFYSPRYIAHMLSEQTLPSVIGYFAGMLYNPNNVTSEAAPVTVPLEIEAGKMVSKMLRYNPEASWTHITSGGTVANIEALWVARTIQFAPLIVQEYCNKNNVDFKIKLPSHENDESISIVNVSHKKLLSLKPDESIYIYRNLAYYLIADLKKDENTVLKSINDFINASKYNVSETGLSTILKGLSLTPKVLVSEAAHYSVKKAANVLGYGEGNVIKIPVGSNFRINIAELENLINNLDEDEYIAAVIGVLGTTEEGAIDPLHEINFLRDKLHKQRDLSFWFHVDAAWGGYIKSMLNHPDVRKKEDGKNLDELCELYISEIEVSEAFDIILKNREYAKNVKIEWKDPIVYKSLLTLENADSITIDPHKLGYIPYPSGMVSFRNGIVTEHIKQEAQYISEEKGGVKAIDKLARINAVGPYIIEGSKPGAAAASCWLAHKAIPLETHGHGKIIRTTLLNTLKLCAYIDFHKHMYSHFEEILFDTEQDLNRAFTFKYLYTPDSNIICFILQPMEYDNGVLREVNYPLEKLNLLNRKLYDELSIHDSSTPYGQEFFVSRTSFAKNQYSSHSLKPLLDRFNISEIEYNNHGIFVLRSTVMNPWHWDAQHSGIDYLMEFLIVLHKTARGIIKDMASMQIELNSP